MAVLVRFVKIMIFTAFLAVLGPVLIFAVIMLTSPGAHLSPDVSRDELVSKLSGAFAMWFGVMFFLGFITFVAGLPKRFSVRFDNRDAFLARLDAAARSVRYRPRGSDGERLVFRPPFYALLAEKMTATVGAGEAEISAPAGLRKKLEKKLS
ncbi:MAG TPA: hypothetical protein VFA21_12935 [Pyrinomonadaceae bacterium]|nr:hypothetical protein [Pyrinomonadaceae bacterium]